jgi:hypothetical protein
VNCGFLGVLKNAVFGQGEGVPAERLIVYNSTIVEGPGADFYSTKKSGVGGFRRVPAVDPKIGPVLNHSSLCHAEVVLEVD